MTNRREFLQIGVAASAWSFVAPTAHAAGIEDARLWVPLSVMAPFRKTEIRDAQLADLAAYLAPRPR